MVSPELPLLPLPGPVYKVQYVIEIVGSRSLNASVVKPLLEAPWRAAAGEPELYVMGPADERWRPLESGDPTGSFDSLALAWDLLGEGGTMSSASASHLLRVAEQYAEQVQRRAISLPIAEEVDHRVAALAEIAEALDIGVSAVAVFPGLGVSDEALAAFALTRGLVAHPEGFEWQVPGWDEPLLSLHRGLDDSLFPSAAPRATVSVGFNLPRCPAPSEVLEAMIDVLTELESQFGAQCMIDDELQNPAMLRSHYPQALAAFQGVGIQPGSAEARKLFKGE